MDSQEIVHALKRRHDQIQEAINALENRPGTKRKYRRRKKRKLSAAAKRRISEAMKLRWAKLKEQI